MTKYKKTILEYFIIILLAIASALCYHVFIFPNDFAPVGINGIITMIQYKTQVSMGYLGLIANVPLAIAVYIFVNKPFAIRTLVFVGIFSIFILVFAEVGFYQYKSESSHLLGCVASGVLGGVIYGYAVRLSASTGGTDLIAMIIQHKRKDLNLMWVIFTLNCLIAGASFFVYPDAMDAVILCIIHSFFNSLLSDIILKGFKSALKVEIITEQPEQIKEELFKNLQHGITKIDAVGMYSGTQKTLLICVIGKRQLADFERIIKKFDNTFVYVTAVNEIFGKFQKPKVIDD